MPGMLLGYLQSWRSLRVNTRAGHGQIGRYDDRQREKTGMGWEMSAPDWVKQGTRCRKISKDGKKTRASIVIFKVYNCGEVDFNYLSGRGDNNSMHYTEFLETYEPVTVWLV